MEKIKVLLVEDEPVLASIIKESLETRGFEISIAVNGVDGWGRFKLEKPDVCVVDIMLPRKSGFSLVTDIRLIDQQVPIIFLTARTQTEDVLKGLETGADDYMKKPFSMEELILRLKALVRRSAQKQQLPSGPSVAVSLGKFFFDHQRLELRDDTGIYALSQREADLLRLLIQHKNDLLPRSTALIKLWKEDSPFSARSMDVYITRLRKFLKKDPSVEIINTRGQGYSLIEQR